MLLIEVRVRDAIGKPQYVIGFTQQMTQRQKANKREVSKTEGLLNAFFINAPTGLAIVDKQLQFVQINKALAEMKGVSVESAIAKTVREVLPGIAPVLEPVLKQVLITGKPQFKIEVSGDTPTKPGVLRSWEVSCFPLSGEEGTPAGVGCAIEEIDESLRIADASRKKAEEALRQSEARFQRLAENLPGVVYQYCQYPSDIRDRFTYISPGCRELYELDPQTVLENADWMWQVIHPDDRTGFNQSFSAAADTGEKWRWEWRIITPSGQLKWIQGVAKGSRQPHGTVLWDGVLLDITDRKLAEEATRQHVELLDLANDCIMIRDLNDKITYWNQGAERQYGWTKAEVTGKYVHTFLQTIFPQPLEEIKPLCMSEGHWQGELIHTKRDGTQMAVSSRWTLQRDSNGEPLAILEINNDISDRKRAEAAISESEERFRATFEQAAVGIVHVNLQGQFLRLNQRFCDIVGYTREEMLELTFPDITPPEDLEADWVYFNQLIAGEIPNYSLQKRNIHKNGSLVWIDLTASVVRDISGEIKYAMAVVEDISDRKRAEQALTESEQLLRQKAQREELLNQLTHQIRNSLDLDAILETVVTEIYALFQLDRCQFYWYKSSVTSIWECVKEAKNPDLPTLLGQYPSAADDPLTQKLLQLEIIRCDDTRGSNDPLLQNLHADTGCTAFLSIPLCKHNGDFGAICCFLYEQPRHWKDSEVDLLETVRDQVAIAIAQADLYTQATESARLATEQAQQLEQTLRQLQHTQSQLIQSEKMASLGQLVAGIAHEINNPTSFIFGNVTHAGDYLSALLEILELYQQHYPIPVPEIEETAAECDLEFLKEDFPRLLDSMKMGAVRIREIVASLRNFSRFDEAALKDIDIHSGIESTLLIVQNRLQAQPNHPAIEVIKQYGQLPVVECFASELNQVLMNVINNAIDAIEEVYRTCIQENREMTCGKIWIKTMILESERVAIKIQDNGCGIPSYVMQRLFDPFFTTKQIGKGTGLGLSISYQIVVDRHQGQLSCVSELGSGTEFTIEIPIRQQNSAT